MTPRPFIIILTLAFCLTNVLASRGQSSNIAKKKIIKNKSTTSIQFDTSKTAIIPFEKKGSYPFDNKYKPAKLTQDDINNIDRLLLECVTDYNNSLDIDHKEWRIDLKKYDYKKQLIVVTNEKGDKEVWVNCFCETWDGRWKTRIMLVDDGGNCFFNFKINLTTNKYSDLVVNGVA
ncbi:MAG: hypothetical protein ABIN97_02740 [Ginsengibacter sp.]